MLLMTCNPDVIVKFCADHPLDMKDEFATECHIGGAGNVKPPTPAANIFFEMLKKRDGILMTQEEYWMRCKDEWRMWYECLDEWTKKCFLARVYRQFYPSFVDSLHVWALLGTRYRWDGKLVFDRCIIDTKADVIAKTDLLLWRGGEMLRVGLRTNTQASRNSSAYKQKYRGGWEGDLIFLEMKVGKHLRAEGNKCWYYYPRDFGPVFKKAEEIFLFPKLQNDKIARVN